MFDSPLFSRVVELAKRYTQSFDKNAWHVDPEVPDKKAQYAREHFDGLDVSDYIALFCDLQGDGTRGFVLTSKGIHWRNGYMVYTDTEETFLSWKELASAQIRLQEGGELIFLGDQPNDERVFLDCGDTAVAEKCCAFLRELRQTVSEAMPK